jgi:hypothetical protein
MLTILVEEFLPNKFNMQVRSNSIMYDGDTAWVLAEVYI